MLQWVNTKLWGMTYNHRLNFIFTLPSGSYSETEAINIGSNAWNFNPYYAFTLQASPRIEVSMRLHYLWNSKNDPPPMATGLQETKAGQAFHINYASSYAVNENLNVGIAGYYLKQLNEHKANGVNIANSQEQVFAIGPGFQYHNKHFTLNFNSYFESSAKNRAEGKRFSLRLSKVF